MELGARKLKILQAVIEAYIQTGEPVGSKALCELLDVSVSSATIRNEMASLSELGLLEQPHTSAGRIPTQFGYRLYINELMKPKPLSDEEMRYIDGYLSEYADDPDLLLEKAAEMLAEMTKYAAISTTPTNRDATIQRIQLVQTGPHTAMLVLTTSTGAVKSKLFRTNYLLNSDILRMFSNVLNEKMGSVHLLNVTPDFIKSTAFSIGELSLMMAPVFVALGQACREVLKTNVLLEGRTTLLYLPEYEVDSVKRLLHFLEQRGELAKLVGAQKEKLGVLIGGESNQPEMIDTSVVLVRYSMGRQTRGTLGVIGPTRMDYPKIVSNLQYLAQSVGGMLSEIMDVGV